MAWPPLLAAALAGVLGLLVGSFLNVVIHRLPQVMNRQWWQDATGLLADQDAHRQAFGADTPTALQVQAAALHARLESLPIFSIARPASRCPACGHRIRWWQNVPVLSYVALRGRCASCRAPISMRYPLVELVTGSLFAWAGWRWGVSAQAAVWALFAAALVALALIDWDTTLLPDDMTLPLLWIGLIAAALGLTQVALPAALWGAVAGYFSLWLVYQGFKLLTGKEGMGFGDFKLFAALGAWFGWQALIPIILMSSVIGAIVGIALKLSNGLRSGGQMPFGPFLAGAGLVVMIAGPEAVLRVIGL